MTAVMERAPGGSGDGVGEGGPGGFRGAVAAEWTKLWSLRSTWWGLVGAFVVMGVMCVILGGAVASNNTNAIAEDDQGVVAVGGIAVDAVDIVQFVVLTLAMLVITGEYSSGSIRSTLQWTPSRARMLLAKASVVAGVLFPVGVALGAVGTAVAYPMLGVWGRFSVGGAVSAALACGVYLALIGVFALGVGAVLRSTAGTLTTVFLLLMVVPMMLGSGGSKVMAHIADSLPSSAGRHFMKGDSVPYPAVAGLVILVAWVVAALWAGCVILRRRDA
ncbi:ABC transporter permease [Actinomadura xylanilytica]|uniref:ABC transporter permease n=1 Tax=Actinomadura xylanilytica TaxID=887459 RepID=UPI00255B103E|nr:ABC transporter permease [Actinomadura xylanilytica]MDL4776893.1 ABC transporter permease [Actinomadura xylanilytica]